MSDRILANKNGGRGGRDIGIDIVRGLAVFAMVGANMGPVLSNPHSQLFRYYGSFAAPTFVTLAGMMVAFAAIQAKAGYGLSYFMKRGLFVCLMGALLDCVEGFVPFLTVEVLYLIGLTIPITFAISRLSIKWNITVFLTIFFMTPLVQFALGYAPNVISVRIGDWSMFSAENLRGIAKHWVVDGWFPVFPWLGYGVFGVVLAKLRWQKGQLHQPFNSLSWVSGGAALIGAGLASMHFFPGMLFEREGFSELFYPATLGFLSLSIGVIISAISLVDYTVHLKVWSLIRPLGEASLFVYLSHNLIIVLVFKKLWPSLSANQYLALYGCLICSLMMATWFIRQIKLQTPGMPLAAKWILGG